MFSTFGRGSLFALSPRTSSRTTDIGYEPLWNWHAAVSVASPYSCLAGGGSRHSRQVGGRRTGQLLCTRLLTPCGSDLRLYKVGVTLRALRSIRRRCSAAASLRRAATCAGSADLAASSARSSCSAAMQAFCRCALTMFLVRRRNMGGQRGRTDCEWGDKGQKSSSPGCGFLCNILSRLMHDALHQGQ